MLSQTIAVTAVTVCTRASGRHASRASMAPRSRLWLRRWLATALAMTCCAAAPTAGRRTLLQAPARISNLGASNLGGNGSETAGRPAAPLAAAAAAPSPARAPSVQQAAAGARAAPWLAATQDYDAVPPLRTGAAPACIPVPGCPPPASASPLDAATAGRCAAGGGCATARDRGICRAPFMWAVNASGVLQFCGGACDCPRGVPSAAPTAAAARPPAAFSPSAP